MAEDPKPSGNPLSDLLFIVVGLLVLVVLWIAQGGAKNADVRGIFLHPPPPVGQGGSYGPQIGTTTTIQQ